MTTTTPPNVAALYGDLSRKPMPPRPEDPAVRAAQRIRGEFPVKVEELRRDYTLTDGERSRRMYNLHKDTNLRLQNLYLDLQMAEQVRLQLVRERLPIGPGAPGPRSADNAVIGLTFRSHVDRLKGLSTGQLATELRDARRFGDDLAMRAVLTVAHDSSQLTIWDEWASFSEENAELLAEWRDAGSAVAGDERRLWDVPTFGDLRAPEEAAAWPALAQQYGVPIDHDPTAVAGRPVGD